MGTPYCYGDLVATVGKGVDGVVLPKVETAADLHSIDWLLANLERDHEFLLQGDVFTKDVISTWIWYKREKEVDPVRLRPHPYEFHLYYDI